MVRGQWGNLARMPGLHPFSFSKGFLITTESQDLGLTSDMLEHQMFLNMPTYVKPYKACGCKNEDLKCFLLSHLELGLPCSV